MIPAQPVSWARGVMPDSGPSARPSSPRSGEPALQQREPAFGRKGERRDQDDAGEEPPVVALGNALDDVAAERPEAVDGAENSGGDHLDRGRSDAPDDH